MMVMGIDPGKTGGLAALHVENSGVNGLMAMPVDNRLLIDFLDYQGEKHVFIEKAQAMPKNGAVSMFNYGVGYGEILGIIAALGIRHTLVPPTTWTKMMHSGARGLTPKAKSLDVARRLWPRQDLRNTDAPRSRKPHEGIVDALLIAEYGRRLLGKGTSPP